MSLANACNILDALLVLTVSIGPIEFEIDLIVDRLLFHIGQDKAEDASGALVRSSPTAVAGGAGASARLQCAACRFGVFAYGSNFLADS